jgi:hypothetical protein
MKSFATGRGAISAVWRGVTARRPGALEDSVHEVDLVRRAVGIDSVVRLGTNDCSRMCIRSFNPIRSGAHGRRVPRPCGHATVTGDLRPISTNIEPQRSLGSVCEHSGLDISEPPVVESAAATVAKFQMADSRKQLVLARC